MTVINLVYTISTKQHSEPNNTAIVFFYRDYGKEYHLIDIHFFFYKQLTLGWQIARELSGLTPFSLSNKEK